MRITQPGLLLVVTSALISGCASTMSPTQMLGTQQIEPHQKVSHGASELQAHYALGKYHLGAARPALAREEFLRALSLDPGNAEVRNGVASAYVQLGDADLAIEHLNVAVANSPNASHLKSNLGYALLLKGNYQDAERALQQAMALDPDNEKARQNWLRLKTLVADRKAAPLPQASFAPRSTDAVRPEPPTAAAGIDRSQQVINIDFDRPVARPAYTVSFGSADLSPPVAVVGATASRPAPEVPDRTAAAVPMSQTTLPAPGTQPAAGPVATATPVGESGGLVVRRVSLRSKDAMGRSADRSLVHGDSRIEVSNGNGVGGMAGRVTQRLRELNLAVTRISNADRFVYRTTRIFFRESHAAEARALSRMLPVEVELIAFPETQMPARVDVRLVIGGDFVAPAQIEQINPAPPVPLAGAETILRG